MRSEKGIFHADFYSFSDEEIYKPPRPERCQQIFDDIWFFYYFFLISLVLIVPENIFQLDSKLFVSLRQKAESFMMINFQCFNVSTLWSDIKRNNFGKSDWKKSFF